MTTQPTTSLHPPAPDTHPDAEDVPFTVADRRRLGACLRIDNAIIDRYGAQLGPYGLAVYTAQLRLANQPGQKAPDPARIAKLIGLSSRRVQRELKKLKHLGLLAGGTNRAHEDNKEEVR